MPEREVAQEILQQEVLDLRGQRDAPASQAHRVIHARDHLEEVIAGRCHHQHVPQTLLGPLRETVLAAAQVLQVGGEETKHQFLDLPGILVVLRPESSRHLPEIGLPEGLAAALHALDVAVDHREELDRIELLTLVSRLQMEHVVTDPDGLSGADAVPVSHEDAGEMAVAHLVVAVADDEVSPSLGVVSDARDDAAGHGRQQVMGR